MEQSQANMQSNAPSQNGTSQREVFERLRRNTIMQLSNSGDLNLIKCLIRQSLSSVRNSSGNVQQDIYKSRRNTILHSQHALQSFLVIKQFLQYYGLATAWQTLLTEAGMVDQFPGATQDALAILTKTGIDVDLDSNGEEKDGQDQSMNSSCAGDDSNDAAILPALLRSNISQQEHIASLERELQQLRASNQQLSNDIESLKQQQQQQQQQGQQQPVDDDAISQFKSFRAQLEQQRPSETGQQTSPHQSTTRSPGLAGRRAMSPLRISANRTPPRPTRSLQKPSQAENSPRMQSHPHPSLDQPNGGHESLFSKLFQSNGATRAHMLTDNSSIPQPTPQALPGFSLSTTAPPGTPAATPGPTTPVTNGRHPSSTAATDGGVSDQPASMMTAYEQPTIDLTDFASEEIDESAFTHLEQRLQTRILTPSKTQPHQQRRPHLS